MRPIHAERLDLVPAAAHHVQAAIEGTAPLADALGVAVARGWPPEHLDEPALRFIHGRIDERPEDAEWWFYFVILRAVPLVVVGTAGYKGPPEGGAVEIGYSIVAEHRRRGYASEAARGLIARAFARPEVTRVIAETVPENVPSIGVLEKCGFVLIEGASEPGAIRFELPRSRWEAEDAG